MKSKKILKSIKKKGECCTPKVRILLIKIAKALKNK